jgi:hypothetical protein
VGVGAECWACVMHVSCAVSPCVDCALWCLYCCAVVSSVCLLCRLWVHALAVFNTVYIYTPEDPLLLLLASMCSTPGAPAVLSCRVRGALRATTHLDAMLVCPGPCDLGPVPCSACVPAPPSRHDPRWEIHTNTPQNTQNTTVYLTLKQIHKYTKAVFSPPSSKYTKYTVYLGSGGNTLNTYFPSRAMMRSGV